MQGTFQHPSGVPPTGPGDQRGAALVEMAVIMPLLVLLIIGVFEIGGAFKDVLTTSNAARDGTRILSAKGNDPTADCDALLAAVDALEIASNFDDLQAVQIFQSNTAGEPIPGKVNTYTFTTGDPGDCADWSVVIGYPSVSRNVLVGTNPLDIVGMRIVYHHDWYTGFPPFRGDFTIDEQTITRLEPEGYE